MTVTPTWPVAALSLAAGFAVADLTGVRPLGGVVLFAAALWCGLRWKATAGLGVALALVAVYLLGFAVSHPLGDRLGAWGAVATISAAVGAVTWAVADRPRTRSGVAARAGR
jgi:hypothetical protein